MLLRIIPLLSLVRKRGCSDWLRIQVVIVKLFADHTHSHLLAEEKILEVYHRQASSSDHDYNKIKSRIKA
jgi:hypothetical protein